MANLVLCHRPCNQRLDNLPLVEKIAMREARVREQWKSAMRRQIGAMLIP